MTRQAPPYLETPRTRLRLLQPDEAPLMVAYYRENRAHLAPWEPLREEAFYTPSWWRRRLQSAWHEFELGQSVCFTILTPDSSEVIGTCNFSNIVHGVFQACQLGYSIGARFQGRGLMHEAASSALDYMFEVQRMHRIMASYMPANERSAYLLRRLGFEREGFARDYLKIAGRWEDHVLTARLR